MVKNMKNKFLLKITALVLLIFFVMPSYFVFDKVEAAEEEIVFPTEREVLSSIQEMLPQNVKHPYIHGNNEKLSEIKQNFQNGDKYTAELYERVKQTADSLLDTEVFSHGGAVSQQHSNVENRVLNLMIAYFVEEDEKYLTRALKEFESLKLVEKWTATSQLDNTQTAAALAVCYDWLYDHISDDDKLWAENTIKEKSVDIAYRYYKDPSSLSELRKENDDMNIWCWRGTYNHITYNNSNLLISSLALAPKYPEYAAFVISNNLYNIQPYLELVGSDGGHEEPVGYYGYTTGKIINMLSAVNSSLGTMYGYENYPGFKTTAYYPFYMYGAGPFSFGDCTPKKSSYNANQLYFTAKHSENTELMSLISKSFSGGDCAKALLWYEKGELDGIKEAKLPLDRTLSPASKLQNIAAFRDSWDISTGLYAAMYAGNANANGHSDAVSGAFAIHADGEIFITPQGIGNYDYPGYWESTEQTSTRWTYYEKRPEANNCLVINPSTDPGQDVNETAIINEFETNSGGGYAVTDLTGVYKDYVTSYKRGIKLTDNRSRVIVQDEAQMHEVSDIFLSFTTPADIEIIDNSTALLTRNGKCMLVKISANIDFTLYEMAAQKLSSSPVTEQQNTYPSYRKLAISAENVTDLKFSAEFIPLDTDYDYPSTLTYFEEMDNWSVNSSLEEKPILDNIYINGEKTESYNPKIYTYEKELPSLLKPPRITFDNSGSYNVSVTYPDGYEKAVIELAGKSRRAWYVIKFKCALTPVADASIGGSTTGTANNGSEPSIKFGSQYYTEEDFFCSSYVLNKEKPGYLTYFKFDLSSLCDFDTHRIKSAKLVLTYAPEIKVDGLGGVGFWKTDNNWAEDTINYQNAPLKTHEIGLSSDGKILPDVSFGKKLNIQPVLTAYEYDITSLIKSLDLSNENTVISFASIMGYKYNYYSNLMTKECADESLRPKLIIEPESYVGIETTDFEWSRTDTGAGVSVKITSNRPQTEKDIVLYLASYSDGALCQLDTVPLGQLQSGSEKEAEAYVTAAKDDIVKVFLWDLKKGIIPIKFEEFKN